MTDKLNIEFQSHGQGTEFLISCYLPIMRWPPPPPESKAYLILGCLGILLGIVNIYGTIHPSSHDVSHPNARRHPSYINGICGMERLPDHFFMIEFNPGEYGLCQPFTFIGHENGLRNRYFKIRNGIKTNRNRLID